MLEFVSVQAFSNMFESRLALGFFYLFWNQGTWVASDLISWIGIGRGCLWEQVRHLLMVISETVWIQILPGCCNSDRHFGCKSRTVVCMLKVTLDFIVMIYE